MIGEQRATLQNMYHFTQELCGSAFEEYRYNDENTLNGELLEQIYKRVLHLWDQEEKKKLVSKLTYDDNLEKAIRIYKLLKEVNHEKF